MNKIEIIKIIIQILNETNNLILDFNFLKLLASPVLTVLIGAWYVILIKKTYKNII